MDTESFRLFLIVFFSSIDCHSTFSTALLTHTPYPSIDLALQQISSSYPLAVREFNDSIECDVGASIKIFFDMINRTSHLDAILTDVCQNVLSSIAETATYLQLPVFSFTDCDLSLSLIDRYPFFYHVVPSDHAHNRVRKELLQYFNWTRFGLIYQHGSKYTLVANDFSNLIESDRKQWQVNLTRGIAYHHGSTWQHDNTRAIKSLLRDFKNRDVRIIIANFNQTIARQMFCHAAQEQVYGSRYQWIMLGYSSLQAWWNDQIDCPMKDFIRAINGTLQTRIPQISNETRSTWIDEFVDEVADFQEHYFDAYAYDTIWTLAHLTQSSSKRTNIKEMIDQIDFLGATGRVRYFHGRRLGEILVEQYVACRMMSDGSCQIPCYEDEHNCNLTVVKIFLAKPSSSKMDPPILYPLNSIMWHGHGPPRDRTNQTVVFEHIYPSVFISISITSVLGLIISSSLFVFNIRFRSHRYIRMSSPSLNNLILAGCMLAYISIIFLGLNSSLFLSSFPQQILMNIICPARLWLLCLSFTLAFGSMFSKTWRVHSIFTNINLTKKGIHDSRLLTMVGALLCIDFFFLIAWQIFDPIRRKLIHAVSYRLPTNPDEEIFPVREECQSEQMSLWLVVLILYKGLLMFYGSFLSWTTRHVTVPALNDSRYIGLSVYIVFICCTLGSLVKFIPSEQIQLAYFLSSLFILICTTATVGLVFVPKIIEVYHDPSGRKRQPRVTNRFKNNPNRSSAITTKHLSVALTDNQQLHLVYSMQEETLNRLMEQFNQSSTSHTSLSDTKPFELERLFVTESELEEDEDDDDDEEENVYRMITNPKVFQGRVARAVSLCLFNKIQMAQLYWPETVGAIRNSTSNLPSQRCSPSIAMLKTTFSDSINPREELLKRRSSSSSSIDVEFLYDGLLKLDETLLNEMIETDLISTSNC